MKILVTGSSGYIGKAFCELASERGHSVIKDTQRVWQRAPETIIYYDLGAIVHFAAFGVKAHERNWPDCMEINFTATRKFLNAIVSSDATPKVFLAGSAHEETMMERLELWSDPYAVSKRLISVFAQDWAKHYKGKLIHGIIFRCYGSGEVWKVAQQILESIEA